MRLKTPLLCLLLTLILMGSLAAKEQSQKSPGHIQGKVYNDKGQPLEGVNVHDGKIVVYSADDGSFEIKTSADSLSFSRLGYQSKKIATPKAWIELSLTEEPVNMPTIRVQAALPDDFGRTIGRRTIEIEGSSALRDGAELLLKDSTVYSVNSSLTGEYQTLSLLGNLSRHTLVMLDGITLNSAGEAFDYSKIPFSQISRIEIIEGSSSAYGGSSAIGGIVNIITKKPEFKNRAELEGSFGSFGLLKRRILLARLFGRTQLSAEYSHFEAENDFKYSPSWDSQHSYKRINNRKIGDSYFLKVQHNTDKQQFEGYFNYDNQIRRLPGPINFPSLYDKARQNNQDYKSFFAHSYLSGRIENKLKLWFQDGKSSFDNRFSSNPAAKQHNRQRQGDIGLSESFGYGTDALKTLVGLELKKLSYSHKNYLNNAETDAKLLNAAFYGRLWQEDGYGLWNYQNSVALRRDHTDGEPHDSWRLEHQSSFELPLRLIFSGNVGTAFSVPSLYDRYWVGDSFALGNENLRSESAFAYRFALSAEHPYFSLKAAWHHSRIKDLIQWRQIYLFGPMWKPFNVGKATIENREFALALLPDRDFSLDMSLIFSSAKDYSLDASGNPSASYDKYLPYTPLYTANINLKFARPSYGATLSYRRTGKQYTTLDNLVGSLPETGILNADLYVKKEYKSLWLRLDMKANNLLNKSYEVYAHIPQPGFNFSLGLLAGYSY